MRKRTIAVLACFLVLGTIARANDSNRPQPVNEGPWAVTQMRYSNDGKRLVVNAISLKRRGPGLVQGWDVRTGRVLFRRVLPQWQDVVFSPNGRLIAMAGNQSPIQLRTLQDGKIVRELELEFPESQNSKC